MSKSACLNSALENSLMAISEALMFSQESRNLCTCGQRHSFLPGLRDACTSEPGLGPVKSAG